MTKVNDSENSVRRAEELCGGSTVSRTVVKSAPGPNGPEPMHTPKEAAAILRVSVSWLAKARMRGDGPAYEKYGRSVRYGDSALNQYRRSRRRLSTSEK
jgi:hypothetical protein